MILSMDYDDKSGTESPESASLLSASLKDSFSDPVHSFKTRSKKPSKMGSKGGFKGIKKLFKGYRKNKHGGNKISNGIASRPKVGILGTPTKSTGIAVGAVLGFFALLAVVILYHKYKAWKNNQARNPRTDEESAGAGTTKGLQTGNLSSSNQEISSTAANASSSDQSAEGKETTTDGRTVWNNSDNTLAPEIIVGTTHGDKCPHVDSGACTQCLASQTPLPEAINAMNELNIDKEIDGKWSMKLELGDGDERTGYKLGYSPSGSQAKSESGEIFEDTSLELKQQDETAERVVYAEA